MCAEMLLLRNWDLEMLVGDVCDLSHTHVYVAILHKSLPNGLHASTHSLNLGHKYGQI